MLEMHIAYHCGPALTGIKPANLVACYKREYPAVHRELERLNVQLGRSGIVLEVLCECEKRVLVMAYGRKALYKCLQQPDMQALLASFGYPVQGTLEQYLAILKRRMQEASFPHEIGAFLGYPAHDIDGFIAHRGEGYLLTGEWKVYRNEQAAKELFVRYHACRQSILQKMKEGKTLAQLFCTAQRV